MDQAVRNKLRSTVTQCRRLLEDAVEQTLQGRFGVYVVPRTAEVHREAAEKMAHLGEEDQCCRADLLAHLDHIATLGYSSKDALAQLVREIAFTHLNRLCAYKMMEARQVYVGDQRFREAVSRGVKSQGFQFFLADHPASEQRFNDGHQDEAYRQFLDWLGGTLSTEIGILFSPDDPANRLYPPQRVLDEVLALINDEALADIWTQDETIGWVYQYFTPKELRDQVRKESQAPRNSYELAFRNQFFTPRYVVEFLTDNTLGRIWYEMQKGDTKLKDQCRFMVRRPSEVFLAEGQNPPEDAVASRDDLSQEELLKLPVYIPHRPKKDPRELKILDPACGSGHFLLYCFDLLLTIYEEAYADSDLGPALQRDYPTLDALRRDLPRLILAHNLHGIDIDLRASQIAALALWLRCQKAYQDMGLKKDRPRITRSNFVCAEPMPGEDHMLQEFVGQIEPKLLGQLVEVVFDKMKLAGEAGSLLKIEEEIRDAVAEARRQWVASPVMTQRSLFDNDRPVIGQQRFDFSGITDAQFFEQAEGKVVEALRNYAEKAQNGERLQRRLFSEDAVRGFAFVDLCHKRFDVVLMNPPFGECSKPAKGLIEKQYLRTKNDLYAAFVEQGLERLNPKGMLGAITSRTGFFLSSFQKWREEVIIENSNPTMFADLGFGVLDTAMVETAAYCLAKGAKHNSTVFFRLLDAEDKGTILRTAVGMRNRREGNAEVFDVATASFRQVPGSPFAYWVSERVRSLSGEFPPFENTGRAVRVGLQTSDDDRFVRCWWEVASLAILDGGRCDDWRSSPRKYHEWCRDQTATGKRWVFFPKGGTYSPFFADIHLVVNWESNGKEMKQFAEELKLRAVSPPGNGPLRDFPFYFSFGLTWSYRTHRLCLQELPAATIISTRGSGVFADNTTLKTWLGLGNSEIVDFLVKIGMGRDGHPQFDQGDLKRIPHPTINPSLAEQIGCLALDNLQRRKRLVAADETSVLFLRPPLLEANGPTIRERLEQWNRWSDQLTTEIRVAQEAVNDIGYEVYGLKKCDISSIKENYLTNAIEDETPVESAGEDLPINGGSKRISFATATLLSYCLGNVFGRWDLRTALNSGEAGRSHEPFAPLPACSPGMLQGTDGLPHRESPEGYPIRIDWDGILVDAPGHSDDIVRRVGNVLEVIWKDRSETIEKEACDILGVKDLRDYFRKPGNGGFWEDHVSRYSKSRRRAPIYWLLQSNKKNYGIWLYYHRLDKDILFKALHNYVEPKIRHEENQLGSLKTQRAALADSNRGARKLDKDIEKQELLMSELRDFEDKLRRAANLAFAPDLDTEVVYDPDLNDGVVLNIAPLHELVPWKAAKSYWEELLAGEYEWSSMGKLLRKKGLVKA